MLRAAVNTALERHDGYATLTEILDLIPEPRAGEVIGLWSLATRHGALDVSARTTAIVHTQRGLRPITLPYLLFGEPLPDPAAVSLGQAARPQRDLLEEATADA